MIALALLAGLAPAAHLVERAAAGPVLDPSGPSAQSGGRYIAYNDDLGDYTCLQTTDQQHATGFRVRTFKQDVARRVGVFPNIFAGFERGRHPENSFLPAEESKDGDPLVAVSVKTATLRLNPFFREATRLGSLSPSWYLTNIAFGFEMRGGHLAGLAVRSFSVQGVRSGTIPKPPPPKKKPNPRKPTPVPTPVPRRRSRGPAKSRTDSRPLPQEARGYL